MSLPAPNLDDRRFQDIVDEAKRRITRYCPEWTDHNVSDPGVALIELFAWMTEMILYRVNQVPDRLYVKFLELVGIELFSASPARTDLLFNLAAPSPEPIRIPAGTQVGTERGQGEDQIVFMTDEDLHLVQPMLSACLSRSSGRYEDHTEDLRLEGSLVSCFPSLRPGDAVYLGFDNSLAGNLVRLDVTVAGVDAPGIDPRRPPRIWQSWDGADWREARILGDTSEGFNSSGQGTLLLARRHEPLAIGAVRAHWLRCKLIDVVAGQPPYHVSPMLESVGPVGLGGAVAAHHAEPAPAELLGTSNGRPGQVFEVRRAPVLSRRPSETVRVVPPRREPHREPEATVWIEVADFADAGPDDKVFTWNGATGEIRFGPGVTGRDGRVQQHGAVPDEDAQVFVTGYRFGGGRRGNVGAGKLSVLLTSIPSVESVRNLDPATGGVDAETVENAKVRGPLYLRGGHRAVTASDFERLTLEAAPGVARARCLPPTGPGDPVRLLIVPRVDIEPESLVLEDLALSDGLERQIKGFLDARRLLTTRVLLDVPSYQGITVTAEVHAAPTVRAEKVRTEAESALYRFINPITGGPDGQGWPFDLDLSIGDVFSVLRAVPGVQRAETVHIFLADLRGDLAPEEARQRVRLSSEALFMSVRHRVVVRQ
ncbi:MAG: putative baseplate assembly protein [Actinobacteria bacterium 13_2_20CM_2_71_6]|nr:MAG: putative baseplate assembly protein [Actinobacteria bacterium 13_2_20CM_2_71_6]